MTSTNDWETITDHRVPFDAPEPLRLWLVHSLNYRYLNDRGQYSRAGSFERHVFADPTAALRRRDVLLNLFPYAFVYLAGVGPDSGVERMSSVRYGDYMAEKWDYLHWKSHSFLRRYFTAPPKLEIYDPELDPTLAPSGNAGKKTA